MVVASFLKNAMNLFYFVVVLYVIYCYASYKLRRRRLEKMMEQFDGPPGIPILGNTLEYLKSQTGLLKLAIKTLETYKGRYRFWLANRPFIVIANPEDFEAVGYKALEKDPCYAVVEDMIGDGLLTSQGEKWKKHHRIIASPMNQLIYLDYFLKVFNKQGGNLMKQLHKEVGTGKHFDLWPYIIHNSVVKICETALGYEEREGDTELMDYGHFVTKSSRLVGRRMCQYWLMPALNNQLYIFLGGYWSMVKKVRAVAMKALKKRKEDLKQLKSKTRTGGEDGEELPNVLDILLDTHSVTDEDIHAEANVLLTAASETTAIAACSTMLMLAIEQDIQEKVYREIFNVFGDSDRLPNRSDLNCLPYLEQCIKESLRMFSPTPLVIRDAREDIPISNGKIIPAGTSVGLFIFGLHHNSDVYPNPDTWDPSNFDPDKVASRHRCSFVAFSDGPRQCIGQKYALLSLKSMISTLLRNYKMTTDLKHHDVELTADVLLRSKHGYEVKLEYRHGKSLFQ